jgi:hypothetical protein
MMSKSPEKILTPSPGRATAGNSLENNIKAINSWNQVTNLRELMAYIDNAKDTPQEITVWGVAHLESLRGGLTHFYSIHPGGKEAFVKATKATNKPSGSWTPAVFKNLILPAVEKVGNPSHSPTPKPDVVARKRTKKMPSLV